MRWLLVVLTVAVLCTTIWAAWPPSQGDSIGSPGGADENRYDGRAHAVVKNVDLRTRTVSVVVEVALHGAWQSVLAQLGDKEAVARVSSPGQRAMVPAEVPLETRMSIPMEIPLSGESVDYPHDRYGTAIRLWITVPDGITMPTLPEHARSNRELRLRYTFIELDKNLRDWTLYQQDAAENTLPRNRLEEAWTNLVHFVIKRTPQTLAFVYGVLILPLLLVLGYLAARHRAGRSWSDTRTSPLELAAALLAVVTLRQVLIPADVAGFTLLDKLLGIEVAAITTLTILSHVLPKSADKTGSG